MIRFHDDPHPRRRIFLLILKYVGSAIPKVRVHTTCQYSQFLLPRWSKVLTSIIAKRIQDRKGIDQTPWSSESVFAKLDQLTAGYVV